MKFCPPNTSLEEVWVNHGTSRCFMESVIPSAIALYFFTFAAIEIRLYKKNGEIVEEILPVPFLYKLQVFLAFKMPCLAAVRFALQTILFNNKVIYGYTIVPLTYSWTVYPLSYWLIHFERNYFLTSSPSQGHGVILLIFWAMQLIAEGATFLNVHQKASWFHLITYADKFELGIFIIRFLTSLFIFMLGMKAPGIMPPEYFSSSRNSSTYSRGGEKRQESTPLAKGSTLKYIFRQMKMLLPYMWPKKDLKLQIYVLLCITLLLGGRVVNLYAPLYSKYIVESMTGSKLEFRWDLLMFYVLFKFLQGGGTGGMGILNNLRSYLWIGVQQYTTREIELELFSHLHGLSLQWHLGRKTGEVLRIMDRGTDSIFNLLNYLIFSIAPTVIDIIISVIFFVTAFNSWFGMIVFFTMGFYMLVTMLVTEWRTKFQRSMNLADNAQKAQSVDSLLNFETVKYYGAEAYETECFKQSILTYQAEEWKSKASLNLLNTLQNVIVCSGLLGGSLLCVYMVVNKQGLTVGDYVLFVSYIMQLYVPLNWFGTYYRLIQKNFVDMENMLELLKEKKEICDVPDAKPLLIRGASVEFRNVSFSYIPEKRVLKNISFAVPAGRTAALVGPSGSGKSTVIRLLFRFYDIDEGEILIDNQNISLVTQESLRSQIGVVPQDTVLFNNTIKFNIRYGRIDAEDHEIVTAAKHADIHQKILNFPHGYETQVGERGLKLSGGEKQRVAIARTLLKAPAIVLLDEATSALDTETERNIQVALNRVCAHRTTIVVAHRLSTIINADEILVIKEGEIVERGTHANLLEMDGVYNRMWNQQIENENEQSARQSDLENTFT
ncbi:hypothetical protein R5R35_001724 [Gryllus longicercus]|uniref:ATP-binding cassette sub-family B member 6 n=1 Tax=Gryllus longicercus TaxID=2509291 RepID=A0AAN9Z8C9_9ORTH